MGTFSISKQYRFEASHQLKGLPEDHQCSRLHGHSYRVELILRADVLDEIGFIVDYNKLKPFGDYLQEKFDHHHLNDVLPCNPTAENIAYFLYQEAYRHWPDYVVEVRVSETEKTWASYRKESR